MPVQHFAKRPFTHTPAYFVIQRQAPGKFDDPVIKHGHTGFQADTHGGAVYLAKYVVWQIAQHVQRHHLMHKVIGIGLQGGIGQHSGWLYPANDHSGRVGPVTDEQVV